MFVGLVGHPAIDTFLTHFAALPTILTISYAACFLALKSERIWNKGGCQKQNVKQQRLNSFPFLSPYFSPSSAVYWSGCKSSPRLRRDPVKKAPQVQHKAKKPSQPATTQQDGNTWLNALREC